MRVLLANYRYFVSGGPERYMFNVSDALAARGHEIIPFSVDYARNAETPYSKYFVSPLGSRDEVYFRDHGHSPRTLLKTIARAVYARDVERAVSRLCADTRPDVAFVLHYLRKLSPSLLVGLKQAGLPIVVRLSDFQMLCPQAHFLRNGTPCQLCLHSGLLPSIRHRCVQGSLVASMINALATWYHQQRRFFDLIDRFVVTNAFAHTQMLRAGFPEQRLSLIPTFVNTDAFHPGPTQRDDIVAYSGRLEPIKGVDVLLDAVAELSVRRPDVGWRFVLAGSGEPQYVERLQGKVHASGLANKVAFAGPLATPDLVRLLSRSQLSVLPSLWFENLPNSLLESYACGTPVLASALGSLLDAVVDGLSGFHFKAGSPEALAQSLAAAWDSRAQLPAMGLAARDLARTTYSRDHHVDALQDVFVNLLKN